MNFRTLLREPLVHFLLAGLAVFAVSSLRGEPADPASRTIIIDEAQVSRLVAAWQQTWQRAPTPSEVDGLIRNHIKDEIYYREALRLGLDQDDTIIRRRLRSKMEFLTASAVENSVPDDATLQAWLDRNPARYAKGRQFSFDQIFLGDKSADGVKSALKDGADWQALGQTISLPRTADAMDEHDVARIFGEDFPARMAVLAPGGWAGPVSSGFGKHLVRLRAVAVPTPPRLADGRQAVENDWRSDTQKAREDRAFQTLLDSYSIKIAKP